MGLCIFSRGGHFAWTFVSDEREKMRKAPATDADIVRLFSTSTFGSGTYRVAGDQVQLTYLTAFDERWTGTKRIAFMHVYGEALTWATETFRLPDGSEAYSVFNFERLE